MSVKYEKNVYLAMLAEQCNRFKEMVQFLEDMVKSRDKDLNSDERNLLSIAYKNSISGGRSAVRTIMAYEEKEKKKENSTFLPYIQEYKKKVQDELTQTCLNVLKTTDEELLKKSEDDEDFLSDYYTELKMLKEYFENMEKDKKLSRNQDMLLSMHKFSNAKSLFFQNKFETLSENENYDPDNYKFKIDIFEKVRKIFKEESDMEILSKKIFKLII